MREVGAGGEQRVDRVGHTADIWALAVVTSVHMVVPGQVEVSVKRVAAHLAAWQLHIKVRSSDVNDHLT